LAGRTGTEGTERASPPDGGRAPGAKVDRSALDRAPVSDALVLDAALRQALVTVRSLGRKGLSVAAMETFDGAPAFSSRWCHQRFVCPEGYATSGYLTELERVLDLTNARIIIPSHDGTISLLRRHRERLERRTRVALGKESAMAIAVNKERTLSAAEEFGIAVPHSVAVAQPEDLPRALKEIGLPAVVKPAESWIGPEGKGRRVASRVVTTPEEALGAVADVTGLGGTILLQPLISGRREAVNLMYANGEVYARFAQWAKRTNPPLGGDSVVRQGIAVPADIGDQAERLVRAIDLEGYSEVEFRRDDAGVPYLMEINPRLSASVEIAVRAGVDFPSLLYQWASDQPIERVGSYRIGGWMRYLGGDIKTTIAALHQRGRPQIPTPIRAIGDFGASFFQPMAYDYLDWRDPLPAARAAAGFVRLTLGKLLKTDSSYLARKAVSLVTQTKTLRPLQHDAYYDAVVVGAGPYGLSAAAHLMGRGLNIAIFGKTLEMWRSHMPKGMLLRSHSWAANLSDPEGRYTFERFFREVQHDPGYPVPRETFVDYGLWFMKNVGLRVDETYVTSIERRGDDFLINLEDGRIVRTPAVVMAIGVRYYAHRPDAFANLPQGFVSHSSDHDDFERFRGKRVVVVGGGQSAVEYAALLHEAGAIVDLVSRRTLDWLEKDRFGQRTLAERIRAPEAGIGPGWTNWVLEYLPYLFYRLPESRKDRAMVTYSIARVADWLRDRIAGKVRLHEGSVVSGVQVSGDKLDVTISPGERIAADHLMLATGFKVDLDQLPMIPPALRAAIKTSSGIPDLSPSFETNVPGLYFIGLTSCRDFGPLYRFVVGCESAAPLVAHSIARRRGIRRDEPGRLAAALVEEPAVS
jgi:cation diffusion facilitator CzcD-associated flavoprotein CzcO/predicted ATP-grasp superfamily ATP-dependent carboligase